MLQDSEFWAKWADQGDYIKNQSNYALFINRHPDCKTTSFSVINKTSFPLLVNFTLNSSTQQYSPVSGTRSVKIRPNNLQFIAAASATDYEYGEYINEDGWDIDVE